MKYKALFSSDWNGCLAPCGPFDLLNFLYPAFSREFDALFKQYTGGRIPLGEAIDRIRRMLPHPVDQEQMDAYLKSDYRSYTGVADLMEWCAGENILFMVNSTGAIGYFQRAIALKMMPFFPVLSAHPLIRFQAYRTDPEKIYELYETTDKPLHTWSVAQQFGIEPDRILLMGDSGGDGPHFSWGAEAGARLIGSMIKPSLIEYCRKEDIRLDFRFGVRREAAEAKNPEDEMSIDFRKLEEVISDLLR